MKIYTKTGDSGMTGIVSGKRVPKIDPVIEAYGTADELNSFVGLAVSACEAHEELRGSELSQQLEQIQHDLHLLCSDLATPMDVEAKVARMLNPRIERLEQWMDAAEKLLPPLSAFILPGGSELSSRLHVCRTIARRTERAVLRLKEAQAINDRVPVYLNRLSDYFFMVARLANLKTGHADKLWNKSL